jgi:predicted O-methyltransferase YrrM
MYEFTHDWFSNSEVAKLIKNYVKQENVNQILEIGSFEGRSSTFFGDNFLSANDSFMICVDPFFKSGTKEGITTQYVDDDVKARFLKNTVNSENSKQIIHLNNTSDHFFKLNEIMFSFIYVDGCHAPEFIRRDLDNSFKFLKIGGIMWMDDYEYPERDCHSCRPKVIMDEFLKKYANRLKVIHKGYQLAIIKIS